MPAATRSMPAPRVQPHAEGVQGVVVYEGRASPAKPSAARRSRPRWSSKAEGESTGFDENALHELEAMRTERRGQMAPLLRVDVTDAAGVFPGPDATTV